MTTGTVLSYFDDPNLPRAEIALPNGDHIQVALHSEGLEIKLSAGVGVPPALLFEADPHLASQLCAGLTGREVTKPLAILVAAITQFHSAHELCEAFREAAARC